VEELSSVATHAFLGANKKKKKSGRVDSFGWLLGAKTKGYFFNQSHYFHTEF